MSNPKFKVGQEVVCINKNENEWRVLLGAGAIVRPKRDEIYTVTGNIFTHGYWWISLKEFPDNYSFAEMFFEPVVRIEELKEILEQQPVEEHVS